jgi:hypothetical protein
MRKFSLVYFMSSALIATVFFDDPHLYYYKRVIYVIFMLFSLWQLYLFFFRRPQEEDMAMPAFYKPWLALFGAFVLYNITVDLFNPHFSLITELNHPYAALVVVPVLAFPVGFQLKDERTLFRFLVGTGILFCVFFVLPIKGQNIYTQGLACAYVVIPLCIFAILYKRYRLFALALIVLSFVYSQESTSRTVVLRLLLFFGLLIALSSVKKWRPLKFLVILLVAWCLYQFLTNLEGSLELFKSVAHIKNFDDEDTRTFLYNELMADVSVKDMLVGRGFQGSYFSPYFLSIQLGNHDFSGDSYYRFSVEVGFLECLLKGGVVFFLLYVTPMVAAIYRGLFTRHNSRLAFMLSVYILCEFLILFVENIPSYHFQFFVIFLLAGYTCRLATLHKSPVYEDLHYNALLQSGPVY